MFKSWLRRLDFTRRYLGSPPWDTGITPPEVLDYLKETEPGAALDLGCGTGTNLLTLAKHGWQVSGVDFAPQPVLKARRRLAEAGIDGEVRLGDILTQDYPASYFDLVLDIGCLHAITPDLRVHYYHNLQRWLKPGGDYLLYAFLPHDEQRPGRCLEAADLAQLNSMLSLVKRTDGVDRGGLPSGWFRFQKA